VIGITNAFNLIDGLDGLSAGSALFSTLVVFCVAVFSNSSLVLLLSIALAGAILGFLKFNFNRATIFLGDCGSVFIGFVLSALALQGAEKSPTIVAVAIPVVSFGLQFWRRYSQCCVVLSVVDLYSPPIVSTSITSFSSAGCRTAKS
jgi:UDP-GlcNAc:undecaprenyl-phosphate/decaprenyl-phosphate GlcNAc-1-phosphate transferase